MGVEWLKMARHGKISGGLLVCLTLMTSSCASVRHYYVPSAEEMELRRQERAEWDKKAQDDCLGGVAQLLVSLANYFIH